MKDYENLDTFNIASLGLVFLCKFNHKHSLLKLKKLSLKTNVNNIKVKLISFHP